MSEACDVDVFEPMRMKENGCEVSEATNVIQDGGCSGETCGYSVCGYIIIYNI